ncbi:predicted protein [Nematostella vectensis]|uniref:RRM domain-containing protein n=1 Tax=Nematostella vectensis TaxID=45351 RepID=A7T8T7_NEMVE|nr:predicted protein [Nematostella vectensis]|eukprot:XP_001619697.1 hypothetical protein NEMVEDRAFT_v1g248837 [Nematostella vectensis]
MTGKRKLFVGGLPGETDDKALGDGFSNWEIEDDFFLLSFSMIVVYDRETRRSRNFGYVTFRDEQDAADAMKQMGGESGKGKPKLPISGIQFPFFSPIPYHCNYKKNLKLFFLVIETTKQQDDKKYF